jgi:hypothetical protein
MGTQERTISHAHDDAIVDDECARLDVGGHGGLLSRFGSGVEFQYGHEEIKR